jgi:hypothetical protein
MPNQSQIVPREGEEDRVERMAKRRTEKTANLKASIPTPKPELPSKHYKTQGST